MSKTSKSDEQGHEPEAGAARPQQESGAAPASGSPHGKPQRFSAKRKLQAVQRLMGGESLEAVSRDLGVPVARLSEWRDQALAAAESSLKAQPRDQRDDEIERLQSKVGEITMDKELLEEKVRRLEARPSPSRGRRSKK
jgi:transposase-like protein